MTQFSIPIRVYIEDTDAGGIVFYANYLRYMERARTEWLRSYGVELDQLQNQDRKIFVVSSCQIDFHLPAKFNEELKASVKLVKCRAVSVMCEQLVMRGETLLTSATVRLACVDADTLSPCAIPSQIKEAMTREF